MAKGPGTPLQLDEQVVSRALTGDRAAFQELVDETWGVVFLFVQQRISDRHWARDLTQDTFMQAFQKRGTLRKEGSFLSWVLTIASRRIIDGLRRKGARPETKLDPVDLAALSPGSEPEDGLVREESREQVQVAMATLDDKYRTVMILRYWSGLTPGQIARLLAEPEGTIRNRIFRAHARLRTELEKSE